MKLAINLSDTLSTHLSDYDRNNVVPTPTRIAHTTQETSTFAPVKKYAVKKRTLGLIAPPIPTDVVPACQQEWAIAAINNSPCEYRIKKFVHPCTGLLIGYIAHYENVWWAFWFAPNKKKQWPYLWGAAVVVKQVHMSKVFPDVRHGRTVFGSSTYEGDHEMLQRGFPAGDFVRVPVGKTKSILISKERLADGYTRKLWEFPVMCNSYHSKANQFRQVFREIEAIVKDHLVSWTDGRNGIFDRMLPKNNSIWYCLQNVRFQALRQPDRLIDPNKIEFPTYIHSYEWWVSYWLGESLMLFSPGFYERPAVRKLIEAALVNTAARFEMSQGTNKELWSTKFVAKPMAQVHYWLKWCSVITSVWPECPIDHLFEYKDDLLQVQLMSWNGLSDYMLKAEAIKDLSDYQRNSNRCGATCEVQVFLGDLRDTLSSIEDVLKAGKKLDKPRRWRLTEWHDHVVAELWKIRNVDFDLPQDLFPKPIHIKHAEHKFCFIQPCSAHQLAQWGQAARNCTQLVLGTKGGLLS